MDLRMLQLEIYQSNVTYFNQVMAEMTNYLAENQFDLNQQKVPTILMKQLLDLYQSLDIHYEHKLNSTSMNVVFRAFFESCINMKYLYKEDDLDFRQKTDIYVYCGALSEMNILRIVDSETPKGQQINTIVANSFSEESIDVDSRLNIQELKKLIKKEKYRTIAAEAKRLKRNSKWYNYFTTITNFRELCTSVNLEYMYLLLYNYLSTDVHGTKLFLEVETAEQVENHDYIFFFANILAVEVLEAVNYLINHYNGTGVSLDELSQQLSLLRQKVLDDYRYV